MKHPRQYTTTLNEPTRYHPTMHGILSRPSTSMDYYAQMPSSGVYSSDDVHREDHLASRRTLSVDPDEEVVGKSTDLSSAHGQHIADLVRTTFPKYDIINQREWAGFIKRSGDQRFSSCWHCIVGRQFISNVTHEMNGFIYMTRGPLSILLFKSGS